MKSIYTHRQREVFIWVITAIALVWLIYGLSGLFPAILSAVIMYTMFLPLHKWMTEKLKINPTVSVLLIIVLSFIAIILPLIILSSVLANRLSEVINQQELINTTIDRIKDATGIKVDDEIYVNKIVSFVQDYFVKKFSSAINVFLNLLLTFTIMYFLLYYMLKEHEIFEKNVRKYIPFNRNDGDKFSSELRNTTFANVLGQGFICLVQGTLVGIGFLIFGIPDATLWGFVSVLVSFLPVIGAPIIFVPAGLIMIANGDLFAGYGIMLWGFLLVTNIDNVLRLIIAKKFNDTHPIITILGVIIGFPMFGILGLVFGPLLISYFIILVKILEQNSEINKKIKLINKSDING